MSLSRLARAEPTARYVVLCVRSAHHAAAASDAAPADEKPSLFTKIAYRFQGVPLKGEAAAPTSAFDNIGKEFVADPLPSVPKDFKEGPERDLVNYPYPERPLYPPKTRLLVLPDSWFTPFQKVTGTSGPYLFFGGLFAFLLNKEWLVVEENTSLLYGFILWYLVVSRSVGYKLDKYLHGEYKNTIGFYKGLIAEDLKDAVEFRKTSQARNDSLAQVKEAFPAILKDNLQLQLEANYRQNLSNVANELKRRVDYLSETDGAKKRLERDLLVRFIVKGVETQTSQPAFKEQYLTQAIQQLKGTLKAA